MQSGISMEARSSGTPEEKGQRDQLSLTSSSGHYGSIADGLAKSTTPLVGEPSLSTRRSYAAVAVLCFLNLLNFMDRYTIAGVLLNIQKYFDINDSTSGLLQTVFIFSFILLAPVFGYLGDRYNRKWIMIGGLSVWLVMTACGSFVNKSYFWVLVLMRALVGTGEASYSTIAPTIIGDMFSGGRRTIAISLFYVVLPVGSFIFGAVTVASGIFGVGLGTLLTRWLIGRVPNIDPIICAVGMLGCIPCLLAAIFLAPRSIPVTYVFVFIGESLLSLNWPIMGDIVLYVVVPTRRATAMALQIMVCHLLGDAASPYIIGVISDSLSAYDPDSPQWRFHSLQYSFLLCPAIAVLGGAFYLVNALYITRDTKAAQLFSEVMDGPGNEQGQQPRGGRRGARMRGGRQNRGRGRRGHRRISDDIRATIVDHVVNHGLTMAEAGRRVQPNIGRSTVSSIVQTFRRENRTARLPQTGGRGRLFTPQQEEAICTMVRANNAMRLREIQRTIIEDNDVFENIHTVSISTIDRVLHRNQMSMKQLYRVPFQRNEDRVKELRYQYVQRIMELESSEPSHNFVYVDEAGFNLTKCRRRGRNIIGHRATVDLPGQRGGNITMCAAISEHGVLTHIPLLGPYNTQHLLNFLETLYRALIPDDERGLFREDLPKYVVICDNVSFHRSNIIRQWFVTHPRMLIEFLPPYSPFLNPIEEFFSAWRWKVYDRQPHTQMTLLAAMDAACEDTTVDACRGWIRHSKIFFPRCIGRENIRCDVDENMWADRQERLDV